MRLPTVQRRVAGVGGLPGVRAPALSAGIGYAGGDEAVQAVLDVFDRQRRDAEQVKLASGLNAIRRARIELFTTPETGLDHLQGEALFSGSDAAREQFKDVVSSVTSSLPTRLQGRLGVLAEQELLSFDSRLNGRLGAEYEAQAESTYSDSLVLARDGAIDKIGSGESALMIGAEALSEIDVILSAKGEEPDGLAWNREASALHSAIIDQLLVEEDAAQASEYFEANKVDLLPEQRKRLTVALNGARNGEAISNIMGEVFDRDALMETFADEDGTVTVASDMKAQARAMAEDAGLDDAATRLLMSELDAEIDTAKSEIDENRAAVFDSIIDMLGADDGTARSGADILQRHYAKIETLTATQRSELLSVLESRTSSEDYAAKKQRAEARLFELEMMAGSTDGEKRKTFEGLALTEIADELIVYGPDGNMDRSRYDRAKALQNEARKGALSEMRHNTGNQIERFVLQATGKRTMALADPGEQGRLIAMAKERLAMAQAASTTGEPLTGAAQWEVLNKLAADEVWLDRIDGQRVPITLPGGKDNAAMVAREDIDADYMDYLLDVAPRVWHDFEVRGRGQPDSVIQDMVIEWISAGAPDPGTPAFENKSPPDLSGPGVGGARGDRGYEPFGFLTPRGSRP